MSDAVPTLALHHWHRGRSARFARAMGVEMPISYGDDTGETRALRESCGLLDRSWIDRLEVIGEDRLRFLNGMMTVDTVDLRPGQGGFGFVTDRKGHILADVVVLVLEDRVWLELPPRRGKPLRAHLEHHIVADRVEIRHLDDMLPVALVGPQAEETVTALGGKVPIGPWDHCRCRILETEVTVVSHQRLGTAGVVLWMPAAIAAELLDELLDRPERGVSSAASDRVIQLVGYELWNAARIAAGLPLFGPDFGPENLPPEVDEVAISYDKGCYIGQEIIARLHYRGRVARAIRAVELELGPGGGAPQVGGELRLEDRVVGRLTSVVTRPAPGPWRAIAEIRRAGLAEGAALSWGDGGTVRRV